MRVGTNSPLAQVLHAYTQQLRGEYAKAHRESEIRQTPARGFEQVTLSREALAMAASNPSAASLAAEQDSSPVEERLETSENVAEEDTAGTTAETAEADASAATNASSDTSA